MTAPRRILAIAAWLVLAVAPAFAATASGPAVPAFVIDPGTRVIASGTTRLTVDCDLRNYGSFTPAAGSAVVLTGYGSPQITRVGFADLQLALHGTASIANATTVAGWLTLGSGWLSLAGWDLTANGGVSGGSPASYVITPDTLGRVVLAVDAAHNTVFPVGNAGYDPVAIRTGTGSDQFRVAVLDAPPTTGVVPAEALTRAWAISHANAAGVNGPLTVAVQWNAPETGAGFVRSVSASNGARAWRWLGGTWAVQPGVRTWDNGAFPAIDTLVTPDAGLWTLAGISSLVAVELAPAATPGALELAPASPNPFRGATTLRYGLPRGAHVTLALYSVIGERMTTFADAEQSAGWHIVRLEDARLASGIYFLRLQAGAEVRSNKLVVMR